MDDFVFDSMAPIAGGTAEFAGATGGILLTGSVKLATLDTSGRYSLKVCTPAR